MKFICCVAVYLALLTGANADPALEALRQGDMKKLNLHPEAKAVSEAVITDPEGGEHRLSDWRGKHVLVNFWATWCAPCREEMPALDALQKEFGGEEFEVVTVATGRNSLAGIETFFAEEGIEALPILLDPNQALARDMAVLGLPVTVIVTPEGQEIGRLLGDADWDGPEARALIDALIAGDASYQDP